MSASYRGLAAIVFLLALAGCATPYKAIDPSVRAQVQASQAVVILPQMEITEQDYIQFKAGQCVGHADNGLLVVVIDDVESRSAESEVMPVRNALADFDFNGELMRDMQVQLPTVDWLHLGKITLLKDESWDAYNKVLTDATTPFTLVVTTHYCLSYDHDRLFVMAHASLMHKPAQAPRGIGQNPQAPSVADPNNEVYANDVLFTASVPASALAEIKAAAQAKLPPPPPRTSAKQALSDEDAALLYWSQNAALTRAALTQAAADVSRLLALSLREPYKKGTVADDAEVNDPKGDAMKGHELEQEKDGRVLLQMDDGTLRSADAAEVTWLNSGKH